MNSMERETARAYARRQEALKDPQMKKMIEEKDRRAKEARKREEVLENWGRNGFYRPPNEPKKEPKQKTDFEARRDDILKNFS